MGRFATRLQRVAGEHVGGGGIPAGHWLDYPGLRQQSPPPGDEAAAARFVAAVYRELDRVNSFATSAHERLKQSVAAHLRESSPDLLDGVVREVLALQTFIAVNRVGFLKLVGRLDSRRSGGGGGGCQVFEASLGRQEMCNLDLHALVAPIGECHRLLCAQNAASSEPVAERRWSDAAGAEQFHRQTTKYWVKPDDMLAVKLAIAKHLPVHVQGGQRRSGGGGSTAAGGAGSSTTLVSIAIGETVIVLTLSLHRY